MEKCFSTFFFLFFIFLYSIFRDDVGVLVDEVVRNTKKLIKATEREIEKWRR